MWIFTKADSKEMKLTMASWKGIERTKENMNIKGLWLKCTVTELCSMGDHVKIIFSSVNKIKFVPKKAKRMTQSLLKATTIFYLLVMKYVDCT